jgi:uncharacterized protein (TIGR03067 family)
MIVMKRMTFLLINILILGCSPANRAYMVPNPIKGSWIPVKQEIGGKLLPQAAYEKQTLTLQDSTYRVVAESTDKGVVRYKGRKMDIYGKEGVNKGKHFTAIYRYESGLLTICYNLLGNSYPEAFETKGNPMFFLSVFKKE